MNFVQELKQSILNGRQITKDEALKLYGKPLDELCAAANELRIHFCGNVVDVCSIFNGKSGRCSENCKYCAQSVHYGTGIKEYSLIENAETVLKVAKHNYEQGVVRFSIITSGRNLSDEEIDKICKSYKTIREICGISLCASHGLLTFGQFQKLKAAGVSRYHSNLETSRRNFPNICTTHTYEDKIKTIKAALAAGLEVCSGGIFGLGETAEDRIDMILDIRELGIKSVPVNVLNPIKGTPFEANAKLTEDELCRIIAVYRFIIPDGAIRLAGGRELLGDKGRRAFQSGANAAISSELLTTAGISITEDIEMFKSLNLQVKMF